MEMTSWTTRTFMSLLAVGVLAQQPPRPQMKLRILSEKDNYTLNEHAMVKLEFTNLTSTTLCFPVPDQDCETTATGSAITTGKPVGAREYDLFICHSDGGGSTGAKLESDIKEHWIKLPPNAVHVTNAAQAKAALNQVGEWELKASYDPPVAAFTRDYEKILQSTAEGEGCELPRSRVRARKIITVLPSTPG